MQTDIGLYLTGGMFGINDVHLTLCTKFNSFNSLTFGFIHFILKYCFKCYRCYFLNLFNYSIVSFIEMGFVTTFFYLSCLLYFYIFFSFVSSKNLKFRIWFLLFPFSHDNGHQSQKAF